MTPETQNAIVELFRAMERVAGKRPTNDLVFRTVRALGFRFKDGEAKRLLAKFRPGRAPQPPRNGTSRAGADTLESRGPSPAGPLFGPEPAGATRARGSGTPSTNPDPEPQTTTSSSARRARASKPYPEIPSDLSTDVQRLVANDAGQRRDGKIADSVVERDLLTLRHAFEQRGLEALRHGISVALNRGLGVRFAAGCVRHFDANRERQQVTARDPGGSVVSLDRARRGVQPAIPEGADQAVYAELARPGEDFDALSRRLRAEDRPNWHRLWRTRPAAEAAVR